MLTSSTRDSPAEKKRLFQAAVAAHGAYMKDASAAQAIDRHWLGLKLCLKEGEQAPDVFSDEVVLRASKWNRAPARLERSSG